MKQYKLISMCFALTMSLSVMAQQKHVVIKKSFTTSSDSAKIDSLSKIDIDSFDEIHFQLDSMMGFWNDDVKKLFTIKGFKLDALHSKNFGFDMDFDSLFSQSIVGDKDLDKFFEEFKNSPGNSFFLKHDFDMDSLSKDSSVEMFIDTVKSDDGIEITKRIIVHSSDGKQIDTKDKVKNKRVIIERKESDSVEEEKGNVVTDLTLSDINVLKLGGISDKVITSSSLRPDKVSVNVNIKAIEGEVVKKVLFGLTFTEKANTQVILLKNDGAIISKETIRNQSGKLKKEVVVKDEEKPYYFLVVRDGKLFSKKIQ